MKIDLDRTRGCLIGLACGDALGTTVEFKPRGSFPKLTDIVGGGPFGLKPGEWTDDTSMALCLAESLIESAGFDPEDQMRRYTRWVQEGHLSSNNKCFDVGVTIQNSLGTFSLTGNPFSGSQDPETAGNGCIMRLAPVPMFFFPDNESIILFSAQSARTTHGAKECTDAASLFGVMLSEAMAAKSKDEILLKSINLLDKISLMPRIKAIADGQYLSKSIEQIKGSGYVVESLEAALWCFSKANNFREAVLLAANLGDDADTTAAICGQIAGAHYGEKDIPAEWLSRLAKFDLISDFGNKLSKR